MEIGNINVDNQLSFEAKSFLESCCVNVIKKNEEINIKENFRLLGQRFFYSRFVDRMGVKFFLYKIKEYKLKNYAEDNFLDSTLNINNEKRKAWEESKKETKSFLKSVTKNVISIYTQEQFRYIFAIIKIQKGFRAHLKRLIDKMEMMNKLLEEESSKAHERTRRKTLQRKSEQAKK